MLSQRVRNAFNRAAETYDEAAETQRQILEQLLACIPSESAAPSMRDPVRILDAGCGTGAATPLLRQRWPQAEIIPADFAERMLPAPAADTYPLCADATQLPIANCAIDLYWSSLAWQWCDLPLALAEAKRVLAPGGLLAVATLTTRTFAELRDAFAGLDENPHTLNLLPPDEIEAAFHTAGFEALHSERRQLIEFHANLADLMRHVKRLGASEVSGERRRGLLGKRTFVSAAARYETLRSAAGLPLGYDVLLLVAQA